MSCGESDIHTTHPTIQSCGARKIAEEIGVNIPLPTLLPAVLYRKRGVGKWPTLTTSLTYLLITLIALPSKFSKSELISRITYIVYLSLLFLFNFHVYKVCVKQISTSFPSLFFPSTTRKTPIKVRSPSSSLRA